MQFSLASVTGGQTRILTVPDANTTIVGTDVAQTLTNKTIIDNNSNIMAKSFKSTTTTIDGSASTAPIAGRVLTATNSTTATWQTPVVPGITSDSVSYYNLTNVTGSFSGAATNVNQAFDGRYIYFVSINTGVIKYDTTLSHTDVNSYSFFGLTHWVTSLQVILV